MITAKAATPARVIAREERRRSNAAGPHLSSNTRRNRSRSEQRRRAIADQIR